MTEYDPSGNFLLRRLKKIDKKVGNFIAEGMLEPQREEKELPRKGILLLLELNYTALVIFEGLLSF